MSTTLTRDTLHRELLKECLGASLTEADALVAMVLLHTHQIQLDPAAIGERNGLPLTFAALTQRHAAQVVAELWSELKHESGERAEYVYWYHLYNTRSPYEDFDDVPDPIKARLIELRDRIAQGPRVAAVVAGD